MLLPALASVILAHQTSSPSQNIKDAGAILNSLDVLKAKSEEVIAAKTIRGQINLFEDKSDSMSPAEAAESWLKLLDASQAQSQAGSPIMAQEVVSALPSPKSWPAITKGLEARADKLGKDESKALAYRLLGHLLVNDIAGQKQDIQLLKKQDAANGQTVGGQGAAIEYMLASRSGDAAWVVEAFRSSILAESWNERIPNFVSLLGKAGAIKELKWLLANAKVSLSPPNDSADQALLGELISDPATKQVRPLWGLITNPMVAVKAVPLLDKLKSDANQPNEASNRLAARQLYCIGLVLEGKTKEAIAYGSNFSWEGIYVARQERWNPQVLEIIRGLAVKSPTKVNWSQYIQLTAQLGHPDEALHLLEKVMADPKTSAKTKASLQMPYVAALLSVDRVDEGVAQLQTLLKNKSKVTQVAAGNFSYDYDPNSEADVLLARLGTELSRPELIQQAIDYAKNQPVDQRRSGAAGALASYLIGIGRLEDAQALVLEGLKGQVPFEMLDETSLFNLSQIYYLSNRPQEILALMDKCAYLGAPDLSTYYLSGYSQYEKVSGPCLGFYVAWALAETGDKDRAFKVLQPCLYLDNAYDPAYALLLKLKGDEALPLLDTLYKHDQFEERPLIWKGIQLEQDGKLEEAATVLRQAISVDPSDGNEPHGDRLRAYDVLAEVLIAQGKSEEATTFKSAVHAIREAEKADDLAEALLLSRAIKKYDSALNLFVDAYCIQSRLAVRLSQEGNNAEAAEHFKKAYELMPSSFGRVETHCFGCEGVFESVPAQHIAETVLGEIAQKTPKNPKVHYLLGYLFEQEGQTERSVVEFRQATQLDPDYLNAWIHLANESETEGGKSTDVDKAELAMLRLDPNGLHDRNSGMGFGRSTPVDLSQLWYTAKSVQPYLYQIPASVYPLTASAATVQRNIPFGMGYMSYYSGMRMSQPTTPGSWIVRVGALTYILSMLDGGFRRGNLE